MAGIAFPASGADEHCTESETLDMSMSRNRAVKLDGNRYFGSSFSVRPRSCRGQSDGALAGRRRRAMARNDRGLRDAVEEAAPAPSCSAARSPRAFGHPWRFRQTARPIMTSTRRSQPRREREGVVQTPDEFRGSQRTRTDRPDRCLRLRHRARRRWGGEPGRQFEIVQRRCRRVRGPRSRYRRTHGRHIQAFGGIKWL